MIKYDFLIDLLRLCLIGKTPHNGAAVDMTHIDVPANMSLWPQFHNGILIYFFISDIV